MLHTDRVKIFLLSVFCLISVFAITHLLWPRKTLIIIKNYQPVNNFQELRGLYAYFNVCIEPLPEPIAVSKHKITFNVTQRIVIHDTGLDKDFYYRYRYSFPLEVSGPPSHPWNNFDVQTTGANFDPERLQKGTAFFISSRCAGNFHHFIKEDFLPLFNTIRSNGHLHPGANNWILYNTPNTNYDRFCRDYRRYDEILRTLHTNGFHDVYYNVPPQTCFSEVVFGSADTLARPRDAIEQIIHGYNLSTFCSAKNAKFVTIVQRNDRRILNIEELYRIANKTSDFPVQLVEFGGNSIQRQLEIACRSVVLIGVNGAALEWGAFMPEGSYVLEIWWRNWRPFFPDELKKFGIRHRTLEADVVRTNWTTYEIRMREGESLSKEERANLFEKDKDNVAKWSDVSVNATKFQESFSNI